MTQKFTGFTALQPLFLELRVFLTMRPPVLDPLNQFILFFKISNIFMVYATELRKKKNRKLSAAVVEISCTNI